MQCKWGKKLAVFLLAGAVLTAQAGIVSFGDDGAEIVGDASEEVTGEYEEDETFDGGSEDGGYEDGSEDGTEDSGDIYYETDDPGDGAEDPGEAADERTVTEDDGSAVAEEEVTEEVADESYDQEEASIEAAEENMLSQMDGNAVQEQTVVNETAAEAVDSTVPSAEVQTSLLWEYRYAGVPNVYLTVIGDWMNAYHADRAIPGTGMIPAISVAEIRTEDPNDIRIYGRFLISDYELSGTTLVDRQDELLVGCFHLQQVSENEYIVSAVEVLDPNDQTGSAYVLANGDKVLVGKLLTGKIKAEQRTKFIRDFVEAYGIAADSYQDGNGTVRPIMRTDRNSPSYVARCVEAQLTDQIVTVGQTTGTNAVLQLHEKQENGSWICTLDVPAFIGQGGLGKTCEGDMRTPVGDFGFTQAFGVEADPGSLIPYTQCDETWFWNGDSSSDRYNQLVSTNEYTAFSMEESERIVDSPNAYLYALGIGYNEEGEAYKGSAIFLHCIPENSFGSSGCIIVSADAMVYLLQNLKKEARILIDTEDNLKTQYRTAKARKADAEAEDGEAAVTANSGSTVVATGGTEASAAPAAVPGEDIGQEITAGGEEEIITETITTETVINPDGEVFEEVPLEETAVEE